MLIKILLCLAIALLLWESNLNWFGVVAIALFYVAISA